MDKLRKCLNTVKALLKPINVYGSIFPLIFALCCSGLFPYKVNKQNLKSSRFCYFVASFNLILFAFSFVVSITKNTSFIECFFKSDISKVGNNIHFAVSFLSMIIIYISCFVRRKQIKNVFDGLFEIDLKMKKLSFEVNHYRGFRYNFIALLVLWTVYYSFTIGSIAMVLASKKTFHMHSWTSYFLTNFLLNLIVFMFVCVLKQIKNRYDGCKQVKCFRFFIIIIFELKSISEYRHIKWTFGCISSVSRKFANNQDYHFLRDRMKISVCMVWPGFK